MGRAPLMLIAIASYFAFFGSFLYLVGWVGGFEFMPTSVDKGLGAGTATAVIINLGLIALFGIQHSVMARQGFKQAWTRIIPAPIERSVYLLATVAVLVLLFLFWHPVEGNLWSVENEAARMVIWGLFWIGWGVLFISTWLLNHFELFGLQQAWYHMRGQEIPPMKMRTPLFYKAVRHPLYTGFFIAFWATPDMTYSHLLAAVGFTIYIVIGIHYEEKDLLSAFGDEYAEYRRRVGSFIPGLGKKA
ncbi:isoprenylcysteine carboxylmethyltransferase family protein [Altererythrobacter arenosus]|uniref:methanethiol S-methyltransferase n=1 Tax=Altererythrobacter arenosus TaxID=3032592 RepID=A0ABY8FNB3_9SPHN|nr:methanethiol S-methyltransferase [Altererythrobacter sp. CAU 1644]WFL76496.1 isoprenylcysteine carboxylmethyltransferase family protein [Altererythrobacter sp. CAU 1644]